MKLNHFTLFLFTLLIFQVGQAQSDKGDKFYFNMDLYYSKSLTSNPDKPYYLCSYYANNVPALNVVMLKYAYNEDFTESNFRYNIGLIQGVYALNNMINEPDFLRPIYESNVGYLIHKNWVIEYGIMPSHIGFESALGIESETGTRSILADNSPYYESGLRLNYTSKNKKLKANINMLDGWQMMVKKYDNQRTAWGHQITYKPNKKITLNSSSYVGPSPTNFPKTRFFHNFYAQIRLQEDLNLTIGFDNAMESQENKFGENAAFYFAPILIAKYKFDENFSISGRYEYFSDNQLALKILELREVHGFSVNFDFQIDEELLMRLEGRYLKHREFPSLNQNDLVNSFVSFILCRKLTL